MKDTRRTQQNRPVKSSSEKANSFVANIPTPVRWQLTRFEDWKKKNYREFKQLFIELYFYNIWGDVVSRSSISSIWILNESIEFVIFHIASCHKVSTLISVVTTLIWWTRIRIPIQEYIAWIIVEQRPDKIKSRWYSNYLGSSLIFPTKIWFKLWF